MAESCWDAHYCARSALSVRRDQKMNDERMRILEMLCEKLRAIRRDLRFTSRVWRKGSGVEEYSACRTGAPFIPPATRPGTSAIHRARP